MGPLDGIRIVDLTSMLSGPWATMILADQGADVIKVEEPRQGDHTRSYGNRRNGFSASFLNLNRNKRSVAIDLKTAQGRRAGEAAGRRRRRAGAELPARRGRAARHRRGGDPRGGAGDRLRLDQRLRREGAVREEAGLRSDRAGLLRPHHGAGRLRRAAPAPHPHRAAGQAHGRDGGPGDRGRAGGAPQDRQGPACAPLHARRGAGVPVGVRHGRADLRRARRSRSARRRASST